MRSVQTHGSLKERRGPGRGEMGFGAETERPRGLGGSGRVEEEMREGGYVFTAFRNHPAEGRFDGVCRGVASVLGAPAGAQGPGGWVALPGAGTPG